MTLDNLSKSGNANLYRREQGERGCTAQLTGPRFLVQVMCHLFVGPGLRESGGVWLLLVAFLELGG